MGSNGIDSEPARRRRYTSSAANSLSDTPSETSPTRLLQNTLSATRTAPAIAVDFPGVLGGGEDRPPADLRRLPRHGVTGLAQRAAIADSETLVLEPDPRTGSALLQAARHPREQVGFRDGDRDAVTHTSSKACVRYRKSVISVADPGSTSRSAEEPVKPASQRILGRWLTRRASSRDSCSRSRTWRSLRPRVSQAASALTRPDAGGRRGPSVRAGSSPDRIHSPLRPRCPKEANDAGTAPAPRCSSDGPLRMAPPPRGERLEEQRSCACRPPRSPACRPDGSRRPVSSQSARPHGSTASS